MYKAKRVQERKGDQTKNFSKGVKPEIGHTQPIPNVLSPNKISDSI